MLETRIFYLFAKKQCIRDLAEFWSYFLDKINTCLALVLLFFF